MAANLLEARPGARVPHPIVGVLANRGLTTTDLAAAINTKRALTSMRVYRHRRAPSAFREAAAEALGLPESELFRTD